MANKRDNSEKICDAGFDNVNAIINRCALLYPAVPCW